MATCAIVAIVGALAAAASVIVPNPARDNSVRRCAPPPPPPFKEDKYPDTDIPFATRTTTTTRTQTQPKHVTQSVMSCQFICVTVPHSLPSLKRP